MQICGFGATAHPELLEFMEKGETFKCPSCCTTGCMTESTWSLLKNVCGRCSGTAETWAGAIDSYLDSEEYKANADRAIKAYFKYNPVMMGLYKAF